MPPPRPLSAFQAKRSLANRFGRLADNVRQLATKLGIRPYRVFLVWSQYDGQVRGEGNESVIARVEVLPTPRVSELTSVQLALYGAGNLPTGTLRIDQISVAKWNEAQLMGRALPTDTDAEHIPPRYDFWYEIVEDGRGGNEPMRTRYRLLGVPFRNAGGVQWGVLVERQQDDATPNGQPQFAPRLRMTVLSLKQVGVFFAPGGEFHQELRKAALDGILSAALRSVQIITTQEVQKASPVPIDRGVYRAGWRAEKITNGAAILNTVPWAVFIEFGVKGSSVKIGRRAIQQVSEWAHRRLGLSDAEAKHAAFAILNAAKKRGIFRNGSGLRILETYTKQRLPAILKAEVERQIAKVQK